MNTMGLVNPMILTLLVSLLCTLGDFADAQKILVDDFELTTEVGKYGSPTDITFLPDGTLLAANKNGIVTFSRLNEYDNPQPALDVTSLVCENGERGLLSVIAHPDYGVNSPYIFIKYTFNRNGCADDAVTGPVNRLSRFVLNPVTYTAEVGSEVVYLDTPALPFDHHNAGDVEIGKDYNIYITIGDGGESPTSQDPSTLFGSILRITLENEIPATNPFSSELNNGESTRCHKTGVSGDPNVACQEIFAMGLRNPFRFTMNPNINQTQFYVNDVGASIWEEVSIGGDGYEGANYGWPRREGPCKHGRNCGEPDCTIDPDYNEPIHFYYHNDAHEGAITGGAFVPTGYWPSPFDGNYIFSDFVFGQIFLMDYTGGLDHSACPVKSNYEGIPLIEFKGADISTMAFGPFGDSVALYFLSRGFGGRLNRISFTGTLNRSPQPVKINVNATSGDVGAVIEFDGTESEDPDGDTLVYEWDLDGDGIFETTGPVVTFQYIVEGLYEVSLKARDENGGRTTVTIEVGIGEFPVAEILSPAEGAGFFVGEEFIPIHTIACSASGPGVDSPANQIMIWEVRQHHANHFHPYLDPTIGNNVKLQAAPSPEDFHASTSSYLEIILSVTNSIGLTTTVSRNIMPLTVNVLLDSIPSGLPLMVDDFEISTPKTFVTWQNHPLKLEAKDPDITSDLEWLGWSNGGDQIQFITIPQGNFSKPLLFRAIFQRTLAPTQSPSTTAVPEGPAATPAIYAPSAPSKVPTSSSALQSSAPSTRMPTSLSTFALCWINAFALAVVSNVI